MTRRWQIEGLTLALALSGALVAGASPTEGTLLARYTFDDDVPTGPDTFRIFQYSKGTVRLTSAYHVSGDRAIELRDVGGDKSMPEIQGYFPVQSKGRVHAHFSFLTVTPQEELNIALAGPNHFRVEKDGIAFWLKSEKGALIHYPGGRPQNLLSLEAFVWYSVDVAYDIGGGTYDLTIAEEGRTGPTVTLVRQENAPNRAGSVIDKFSFVGEPFGDASNVVYYVDDIVIGGSETAVKPPFVAPGRRKLFTFAFVEYRARESARPRCLPGALPEDFGLTAQDTAEIEQAGALDLLASLATGQAVRLPALPTSLAGEARRRLEAAVHWSQGCAALQGGDAKGALERFQSAFASAAEGRIHSLSIALALVALGRAAEADERLALARTAWGGDARYAVALAMAGTARGDLDRAEAWLREPAETVAVREGTPVLRRLREVPLTTDLLADLKREAGDGSADHLTDVQVSEQYFYVLLWRSEPEAARDYALRMVERYRALSLNPVDWVVRAGDAAFYGQNPTAAKASYDEALELDATDRTRYWSILLKLCDIAFVSGDLAAERALREQYYGALR